MADPVVASVRVPVDKIVRRAKIGAALTLSVLGTVPRKAHLITLRHVLSR